MGKSDHIYWQRWQKLLEAAANFQGVETGVRQLRRNRPLETEQIHITGKSLTILYLFSSALTGKNKRVPPSYIKNE